MDATASTAAPPAAEPAPLRGGALALLTVGLALGTLMEVLDTSIANVAVPTISGSLGVATSQSTWVISSCSVASAIAMPLTFIVFAFVSFWNSTFTLDVPFNHVIWPRLVQGIGVACFFVPMTTITLSSVPDERLASASGLSNFFRTLSGAIATAISTTFWKNDTIYHHAMLADSVNVYSANTHAYTRALAGVGLSGDGVTA